MNKFWLLETGRLHWDGINTIRKRRLLMVCWHIVRVTFAIWRGDICYTILHQSKTSQDETSVSQSNKVHNWTNCKGSNDSWVSNKLQECFRKTREQNWCSENNEKVEWKVRRRGFAPREIRPPQNQSHPWMCREGYDVLYIVQWWKKKVNS